MAVVANCFFNAGYVCFLLNVVRSRFSYCFPGACNMSRHRTVTARVKARIVVKVFAFVVFVFGLWSEYSSMYECPLKKHVVNVRQWSECPLKNLVRIFARGANTLTWGEYSSVDEYFLEIVGRIFVCGRITSYKRAARVGRFY